MMMTNAVLTGETVRNANTSSLYVFGRLKPGVTAAQASEDIARVYRDLPRTAVHVDDQRGEVVPMSKGVQTLRPRFERPLLILFGVVGLLLLLACANLAALLTARAAARYREIAVRLSLGASGARLARQFLTETLLLAGLGGIAGLLVAWWGTSLLIAIVTSSTRRLPLHFALDWRIVAFTSVVSILTAILFGLLATSLRRIRSANGSPSIRRFRSRMPSTSLGSFGMSAITIYGGLLPLRSTFPCNRPQPRESTSKCGHRSIQRSSRHRSRKPSAGTPQVGGWFTR